MTCLLKKIWHNFEEYVLVVSFVFVVPLLFMQIVMRYVFNDALSWSEELARYIFLWQIWLGASYGVKKSKHIRIDIIKMKMSTKASTILETFVIAVCIGFCVFIAMNGTEMVSKIFSLGQISAALALPMGYPYLSIPVGAGLMTIRYIEKLLELWKGYRHLSLEGGAS